MKTLIKNFFIWCSGASVNIINKCDDKEISKYISIGIVIPAVSLLSIFSSTYFLSFAFGSGDFDLWLLPIGIIWGALLFSLHRMFVSTVNKLEKWYVQFIKVVPMLILSLILGLIISTPIELKIFEREINEIMYEEAKDKVIANMDSDYQTHLDILTSKVEETKYEYDNYHQMYEDEVAGKKSGIPGKGARSDEYMKMELDALKRYNEARDSLNSLMKSIVDSNSEVDIDNEIEEFINKNNGVLKRVDILYSLGNTHTVLTILFILIELLPLITKLLSPAGSYEPIAINEKKKYINLSDIETSEDFIDIQKIKERRKLLMENVNTLHDNFEDNLNKLTERQDEILGMRDDLNVNYDNIKRNIIEEVGNVVSDIDKRYKDIDFHLDLNMEELYKKNKDMERVYDKIKKDTELELKKLNKREAEIEKRTKDLRNIEGEIEKKKNDINEWIRENEKLDEEIKEWESKHWKLRRGTKPPSSM